MAVETGQSRELLAENMICSQRLHLYSTLHAGGDWQDPNDDSRSDTVNKCDVMVER